MPRPPKTWKAVELAIARLLGGRRCHFEGQDVQAGDWAVEVNHGKQVPRTLLKWWEHAQANTPEVGLVSSEISLDIIYHWYHTTEMARVKVSGFRCERCKHTWVPRHDSSEPKVCPKCKSPYWDTPRKNKRRKEQ